ncbi:50S ribosomal protein L15 [Candidatus Gracilibacteria bacterium]|nr:MAG: 50S ribosomal protein L15 [Candidatus Gracilibacteria bacterium]
MKHTTLKPNTGSKKLRTRVARGRGTGIGGTSGRGFNGQNSRTGRKRYPSFEGGQTPLFRRLPKRRGFTAFNPTHYAVINLDQIEKLAQDGATVIDYAILYEKKLVRKTGQLVKVLGRGKITQKVEVEVDAISESAKKAIEKAGGSVKV